MSSRRLANEVSVHRSGLRNGSSGRSAELPRPRPRPREHPAFLVIWRDDEVAVSGERLGQERRLCRASTEAVRKHDDGRTRRPRWPPDDDRSASDGRRLLGAGDRREPYAYENQETRECLHRPSNPSAIPAPSYNFLSASLMPRTSTLTERP